MQQLLMASKLVAANREMSVTLLAAKERPVAEASAPSTPKDSDFNLATACEDMPVETASPGDGIAKAPMANTAVVQRFDFVLHEAFKRSRISHDFLRFS